MLLLGRLSDYMFALFKPLDNSFPFFVLRGVVVGVCRSSKQVFSNPSTNVATLDASTAELMRLMCE